MEMDGTATEGAEATGIHHADMQGGDEEGPAGWDADRLGPGENDKDANQVVLAAESDPSLNGEGENDGDEGDGQGSPAGASGSASTGPLSSERKPLGPPPGGEVLAPVGRGNLVIAVISGGSGNANEISKRDREAGYEQAPETAASWHKPLPFAHVVRILTHCHSTAGIGFHSYRPDLERETNRNTILKTWGDEHTWFVTSEEVETER